MADSPRTIWPISLAQIEETVSTHMGPGRVSGNAAGRRSPRRANRCINFDAVFGDEQYWINARDVKVSLRVHRRGCVAGD
jgi:hypothetical protein